MIMNFANMALAAYGAINLTSTKPIPEEVVELVKRTTDGERMVASWMVNREPLLDREVSNVMEQSKAEGYGLEDVHMDSIMAEFLKGSDEALSGTLRILAGYIDDGHASTAEEAYEYHMSKSAERRVSTSVNSDGTPLRAEDLLSAEQLAAAEEAFATHPPGGSMAQYSDQAQQPEPLVPEPRVIPYPEQESTPVDTPEESKFTPADMSDHEVGSDTREKLNKLIGNNTNLHSSKKTFPKRPTMESKMNRDTE